MKKLNTLFFLAFLFSAAILLNACNQSSSKTIDDLVNHFEDNGFKGKTSDKAFAMIGAIDGAG